MIHKRNGGTDLSESFFYLLYTLIREARNLEGKKTWKEKKNTSEIIRVYRSFQCACKSW